jgi:hypothetical protein
MGAVRKPGVFFSFRRPGGIVERRSYRTLSEALRKITESEEMRPFMDEAHATGRDTVVGVLHSGKGRPLLVIVAAATNPVPDVESNLPGGWDGSAARNDIG